MWPVLACRKMLGTPSSGVTPLEVLVYGDVNMTGVDFVKETTAVVLPPRVQAFPVKHL